MTIHSGRPMAIHSDRPTAWWT